MFLLQSKVFLILFSNITVQIHQFLLHWAVLLIELSLPFVTTEKTIAVASYLLLIRLCLDITLSYPNRPDCFFLEVNVFWSHDCNHDRCEFSILKKDKVCTTSISSPSICIFFSVSVNIMLVFLILSSSPAFALSSFTFISKILRSSSF